MTMVETDFTLTAPDGAIIPVIRSAQTMAPSKRAVVLAHGLTGHPREHLMLMARNYFVARGYDVYRMSFYADSAGARMLHDSTLETHALDLNTVMAHVNVRHAHSFICGHSYGGLTMLYAQPQAKALAFWDSAFVPNWLHAALSHKPDGTYTLPWGGVERRVGHAMVTEAQAITAAGSAARAQKITLPSLVVVAGADPNMANRMPLFDALTCQKELVIIEGADHQFTKGYTADMLAEATCTWFDRF